MGLIRLNLSSLISILISISIYKFKKLNCLRNFFIQAILLKLFKFTLKIKI